MILTHPGLTKLTFMDYLLTMLRILLRRKQVHDRSVTLFHTSRTPTYTKSHLWKGVKQNRTWTKSNLTL